MGKESEGVANDNLYHARLDAFLTDIWSAWRSHLVENASFYVWGTAEDLWRWWHLSLLPFENAQENAGLALRNEVVWDKGSGMGMGAEAHRMYATTTERCLFAQRGAQEYGNTNAADYWEGWEPIRAYLDGEVRKMGWGPKDIKRICGVGMYAHWFSKSQWVMIPERHYLALQSAASGAAFVRPYSDQKAEHSAAQLSGEHLALRHEWAAGRAYFDNTHDTMRDVWEFPRVIGAERCGHATPKPIAMMERIARSSAPSGGLVIEPFGGSGSTLMGCAATGRICYTMELLPEWVDVIRRRWTTYALANDLDPGTGALE
jgi:DNA modification methylase